MNLKNLRIGTRMMTSATGGVSIARFAAAYTVNHFACRKQIEALSQDMSRQLAQSKFTTRNLHAPHLTPRFKQPHLNSLAKEPAGPKPLNDLYEIVPPVVARMAVRAEALHEAEDPGEASLKHRLS